MSLQILIISDDGTLTNHLSQLLASAGHHPVALPVGADPFRAAKKEKPDLILLAVEAARLPALAVEQRLHTSSGTRTIPVIVISDALSLEVELLQVFDFIPKPLDTLRLLEDLAMVARKRKGFRQPPRLTDREYQLFSSHILSCTGLHFETRNRSALERGVRKRMGALLMDNSTDYLGYLKKHGESRHELQKLLQFLTVGETYFFRYPAQYEALRESLQARADRSEPIRIWSAGCSTGEEPYSIAITVMEALPDWRERDIRIIATDINSQSLSMARTGLYNPWSMRSTERRHLERHFDRVGESFMIRKEVKELVRFFQMNLSAPCPGERCDELRDFDAIFCRNVLIYFAPHAAAAMVEKFAAALKPGGQLFLGHAETMLQRCADLEVRRRQNCFFYVKAPPDSGAENHPVSEEPRPPLLRAVPQPEKPAPQEKRAPQAEESVEERLKRARGLFDAEQIEAAGELVAELLAEMPKHPEALILHGFVLASRGRIIEALETCTRAIAINDLIPDAYFLKGMLLDACDLLPEAADEYRKALLLDHDFIMPRYYMGRLHLRLGRVSEAAREIRNSIRLLSRRSGDETIPYSGGLSRSDCLLQLQNALAQVA